MQSKKATFSKLYGIMLYIVYEKSLHEVIRKIILLAFLEYVLQNFFQERIDIFVYSFESVSYSVILLLT